MKKIDKKIYNRKYYEANKASNEVLNAIEYNLDLRDCEEFEKMVSENNFSKELFDDMVNADKHELYFNELKDTDKETDVKNLINNLNSLKRNSTRRRIILGMTTVAAAMAVMSFLLLNYNKDEDNSKIILAEAKNIDIKEPILIFDSGDTITIDKHREYNKYVEYNKSGKEADSALNKYNTVIIPAGYTHKLILSDGTKVTLNAGSRLKYPTTFSGNSREVELDGEAYFDVTKSDEKFIVNSLNSKIEVFGTQFNVRSKLNGDMEAVLVEGSIGFRPSEGDLFMIAPGTKLSYVSKNNSVTTEDVDLYTYTAWMDNKFVYKEQPLVQVMNDIAAWYGIKVSSIKALDDLTLTLVINRDTPVDDLMRIISLTLNINIIKEKGMEYTIE